MEIAKGSDYSHVCRLQGNQNGDDELSVALYYHHEVIPSRVSITQECRALYINAFAPLGFARHPNYGKDHRRSITQAIRSAAYLRGIAKAIEDEYGLTVERAPATGPQPTYQNQSNAERTQIDSQEAEGDEAAKKIKSSLSLFEI